jgi:HK97 family phage major capsid protein
MSETLKQLEEKLAAKRKQLYDIFQEAGVDRDMSKIKSLDGDNAAKLEAIQTLNKELNGIGKEIEAKRSLDSIYDSVASAHNEQLKQEAVGKTPEKKEVEPKSIGEMFVKSGAMEHKEKTFHVDVDTKTLFQTSAGWDPEERRIPRVELYPTQELGIMDYIPTGNTDRDLIKYMKESTFTNNAAEKAAGDTYGEGALALTETSDEVEKITVWLPVTDEQMEDVPGIAAYVNSRLSYMINARLETQVLTGDGNTPNLLGTLTLSSLQSQAKGSDPVPDAIHKAMTLVESTGFAKPNLIVMHPNDWQGVRLLRTADGIYIFGSPMEAGPKRLWGLPVVTTTFETENTAIVGAYRGYSMFFVRRGIEFAVSNSHDDYFIKGKQAIRCDMRGAMVHFRDTAFCEVTSI